MIGSPGHRSAKTLEQLRVFIAVAERLHVTNAARALNIREGTTQRYRTRRRSTTPSLTRTLSSSLKRDRKSFE